MRKLLGPTILFLMLGMLPAGAQAKMSWIDCVREAGRNNPDLLAASESVVQSRAARAITASSLFPELKLNGSAGETQTKLSSQKATHADSYSYGLSGSLLLFDGLKSTNSLHAARESLTAANEGYRFASADVRWQLRNAFINLLKAQELIRVSDQIASIREDELKLITLRYNSGLEHRGALLDSQVSLKQAKLDLVQALRSREVARQQLNRLMGKDIADITVAGNFDVNEDFRIRPDFKAIAAEHPSVKQAVAKNRSADFSLRSTRGSYYPQISLQGAANKNGSQWPPEARGLSAQLVVSLPLFEGGLRQAQVKQADSLFKQTSAQLKSTQDSTALQLAQSWESYREAVEALDVSKDALAAAEERSRIAEVQYATGFITYDNWTIISNNLVQTKKSLLNAQANALSAEARWIYAKGETLEYANE